MKVFCSLICIVMIGCTTISQVRPDFANSDEERAVQAINTEVKAGNFAEAVTNSSQFEQTYPYSLKLQKVRFQKAQALEGLGKWNEAVETYTAISNFSKKSQPEIAAQSVYRLSFVYEALNDNQRVLTSLFEAQRLQEYLPAEVGLAEIPARLAIAYTKENNPEESQRWLEEADRGLKQALEIRAADTSETITTEWLAKIYYNMGSVSTNQLTIENIESVIRGQQSIQKYLIKAMQYNDPVWSPKASKKLQATFADIWTAIEQRPATETDAELSVALKLKRDQQIKLAGPFIELVDQALSFQPGVGQLSNASQSEFFTFLKGLKPKVEELLHDPIYTPLIHRGDKASPKHSLPGNLPKSEDPN